MKKLISFLLIAVLLLSLCACQPAGKGKTLGFVQRYDASTYESLVANSFTTAAEALGYKVSYFVPADATAETQKTMIQQWIQEGVAGIAVNPNDVTSLESVLQEAKDAGIPVITIGADTAGSALLVQPGSPEMMGKSLMDAMYDMTGGEGSFVVISGTSSISGQDQWVSGMQLAAQDSKYKDVHWVETNYAGRLDYSEYNMDEIKELLNVILDKYPDLEAICCVGGNILAPFCKVLEDMDSEVRITGMAQPSQMKDLVGKDRACPYYFQWDPNQVGSCAAQALIAMLDDPVLEDGGKLTTAAGEYPLYSGYYAPFQIYADAVFRFEGLPTDPDY